MSRRHVQALVASLVLLTVISAALSYRSYVGKTRVKPPAAMAITDEAVQGPPGIGPREPPLAGLVLTLTARRPCWIRTLIDGGQQLERLLKTNETVILRANEEAFLRAGDASALSLLINNRPAKPLGATGQVVTAHITRSNYVNLLDESSRP
jgi:hypothetical protein